MREGCPLPLRGEVRGASPGFFFEKKKWCHLVHSEIFFGAFLNALKHHVYGAGKSFSQPPPPIIRPFWKLFYSLKHHVYGVGNHVAPQPPPPKKKKKEKKKRKKEKIIDLIKYIVMR